MKQLICLILCLLLLPLPMTAAAAGTYVIDEAGLLDAASEEVLQESAAGIYETYGVELVILTVDTLGFKSAQEYADDSYDEGGYGDNGILFLLAMAEREWYISTAGTAIDALHDNALMEIEYEIIPYLSEGAYYEGFAKLQSILPYYLDQQMPDAGIYYDVNGNRYVEQDYESEETGARVNVFFSLIFGAVIAAFALMGMRSTMNTKTAQRGAANYQTEGSYRLTRQQDLFLYSNVTKRPRQQNTGTPGARTGGGHHHSTMHRSHSGRSHGGRGGRF